VYVPIVRGPTQKEVWTFAKRFAQAVEVQRPDIITAEYRIARRPEGRVLVDYNQNAWGRTLASIYSPRPKPTAAVSTPVTWQELEEGAQIDDFTLANVPGRLRRTGDLWAPLLAAEGRFDLRPLL
jgi:bifunctional non-homologous end joining protein LigD